MSSSSDEMLQGPLVDDSEDSFSFFRSAPMSLIQLYIPSEAAQAVVAELGGLGAIQFEDLNPEVTAFQRTFTGEIRRLDEMERKIRLLLDHCAQEGVTVRSWLTAGPVNESSFVLQGKALQELDELEPILEESESRTLQLDQSQTELLERYLHMLEWHGVLIALAPFLETIQSGERNHTGAGVLSFDSEDNGNTLYDSHPDLSNAYREEALKSDSMELGNGDRQQRDSATFVAGAISRKKMAAFERVLWRALRGNVFIRSADLPTSNSSGAPVDGEGEYRSAFVAYVHGQETLMRLEKICIALGCSLYEVDASVETRLSMIGVLESKLDDLYTVLFSTRQAKRAVLGNVCESLDRWLILVSKKKILFDTMNSFSCDSDISSRKYYLAEGWCPTKLLPLIDTTVRTASERAGLTVAPVINLLDGRGRSSKSIPPTYFPTNRFTQTFQDMTDAYGVGKYGEANPSIFMIVSFPFLFAIMFGDVGHALIMAAFGAWMVLDERRLMSENRGEGEIFSMIFGGRYIILMMGLFSVFTGIIYNDFFSRAMSLFTSAWTFENGIGEPARPGYVYPIGIDPAWSLSSNMMLFMNSYKMKQAVLIGITQMTFGILVSATNYLYFGNMLDMYCTFLPQFIFMVSLFGYLSFLIVYKWIAGWDVSILNLFIAMILKMGAVEGQQVFRGQQFVQVFLLLISFLCIPWMLLAKPIYIILEKRRGQNRGYRSTSTQNIPVDVQSNHSAHGVIDGTDFESGLELDDKSESASSTTRKATAEDEEHGMGEMWVHQLIHTIEFVLGSVSNTASYLRLWALSLAHAELSEVLWKMTIAKGLGNPIAMFISFAMWFVFTIGILVGMEGMSAFLHALRLHWVEFNNKFYSGGGIKFEPFNLRTESVMAKLASIQ